MIKSKQRISTPIHISTQIDKNNLNFTALALLIKVLELKYVYNKAIETLLELPEIENKDIDIDYCAKNILTIDKYIKNVLLKLRLRNS